MICVYFLNQTFIIFACRISDTDSGLSMQSSWIAL